MGVMISSHNKLEMLLVLTCVIGIALLSLSTLNLNGNGHVGIIVAFEIPYNWSLIIFLNY